VAVREAARSRPSRWTDAVLAPGRWAGAVALGALGALPSILWAVGRPGYLTDDFAVARTFDRGLLEGMYEAGFEQPARPLVGPYWWLVYDVIGDRPVVQALLLALLNGSLAAAAWLVARRLFRPHMALAVGLVVALAPNRGSTRLWFIVGSYVLVAALGLLAVWLLWCADRPWASAAVFTTSALLYEGVVGLAGAAIALWWWEDRGARLRVAVAVAAPVGAVAVLMLLISPKGGEGPGPFDNAGTLPHGLFGAGLWDAVGAGEVGLVVILLLGCAAAVTRLPSFRTSDPWPVLVGVGAFVVLCTSLPFMVGGAPFATVGIFDRNNLFPTFGVAIVLGAAVQWVAERNAGLALAILTGAAMLFLVDNTRDVRDYEEAVRVGHDLVDRILVDVDPTVADAVLVGPALDEVPGVAAFVYPEDLTAALVSEHGSRWSGVSIPFTGASCAETARALIDDGRSVAHYDRLLRQVETSDPVGACEGHGG